jgi:hypothetical protein
MLEEKQAMTVKMKTNEELRSVEKYQNFFRAAKII